MANKQDELEQRRQELAGLEEDLRGLQEGAEPPIRDLGDERLASGKQASVQRIKSENRTIESASFAFGELRLQMALPLKP